ncbi:hypothetical protein B0H13DRAFT_1911585 [Mycena leptocephala]|nr:hypothetical protein B0H13DRAFT_1911585 [Mycena leptocephala]
MSLLRVLETRTDPGIVELVQSDECAEVIIQRRLDNSPHTRHSSFDCCNRCDPLLRPAQEYQKSLLGASTTEKHLESAVAELRAKALIPDSDLEELAAHTSKIFCVEDMHRYTHIVHCADLSPPLFDAIQDICEELNLLSHVPEVDIKRGKLMDHVISPNTAFTKYLLFVSEVTLYTVFNGEAKRHREAKHRVVRPLARRQ